LRRAHKQQTTRAKAELHDVLMPLVHAMYEEFKEFGKKKPDAGVAKSKIEVVNRLLDRCRAVLKSEASLQFLDLLDEDDVPENSDVILMLSQYVAAMEQFKQNHYGWDGTESTWFTKD